MKVIDLLQRIANGEEVPKKIKSTWVYEWSFDELRNDFCYLTSDGERFDSDWLIIDILENEVEIIEEDKKIEKVNTYVLCDRDFESMGKHSTKATEIIDKAFEEYSHKINEIIDYLEENK